MFNVAKNHTTIKEYFLPIRLVKIKALESILPNTGVGVVCVCVCERAHACYLCPT